MRSIFGLPKDTRAYALLKTRDFLVGLAFGTILILATILTVATTSFLGWLSTLLGLSSESVWSNLFVQAGSVLLVFVIDTLALAVLFRFLSGAAMPWRRMWVGSLLGSAALSVLQLLGGLVITGAGTQPAAGDLRRLHHAAALVPAHRHRHPRRGELDRGRGVRRARVAAPRHARAARRGGARPRAAMRW